MTGRIRKPSLDGAHYFVVFLDDCTAMSSTYFITKNLKFMECLRAYKALTENESCHRMYAIHLDNAGKQNSQEFRHFINDQGMTAEFSPAYAF